MIGRTALAIAVVAALTAPASAHVGSDGFVELAVDGAALSGRVDLAARDLHDAIGLDDGDGALTWAEIARGRDAIATYVLDHVAIDSDRGRCRLTPGELSAIDRADGTHVAVAVTARCPAEPARLRVEYRAIFAIDAQHRAILRIDGARGTTTAVVAAAGVTEVDLGAPTTDLAGFVRSGIHHIWAGVDHILFLLALLLPAVFRWPRAGARAHRPFVRSWRRARDDWQPAERFRDVLREVLEIVTAFTLAHSITLVVSALGWVRLPPRLVETAIALSVALAAINNLVRVVDARWAVAFALGLLHGFGFSNVLAEVGLPGDGLVAALLAFNVGVELGQAAIVAAFLPLAFLLRRTTTYRVTLLAGSAATFLLALRWSFERFTS